MTKKKKSGSIEKWIHHIRIPHH